MRSCAIDRFNAVMSRCQNMIDYSSKEDVECAVRQDILRSVVVLAVAALDAYASDRFMEDFTRNISRGKLSCAEIQLLKKAGVTVELALELLSGSRARPYGVIRAHIESHFATRSRQSFKSINELYKYFGVSNIAESAIKRSERKTLSCKIDGMLKRRHKIVHEGDYDKRHRLSEIERSQVEMWVRATKVFVENMEAILCECIKRRLKKAAKRK